MPNVITVGLPAGPGGMNTALAPQEIDDTEDRYIQDAFVDLPGIQRRRGPVVATSAISALPRKGSGLVITVDPAGSDRFAALTGTGANGYFTVWNSALNATVDLTWPHVLPTDPASGASTAYRFVHSSPALNGGTWVGAASDFDASAPNHGLALWRGGNKADYSTGTITLTRGSAAVTGSGTSWSSNAVPGMFLFANTDDASAGTFTSTYIGAVLSVNSDTSITLTSPSPYSGSAGRSYSLISIRGFIPKVSKGRITTDTSSTTVSGGSTKFVSQGLGSGTWNLYRSRDFTWIGKVTSVQSDISLTLTANAAIALADEAYVAIRGDWATADKSIDITGSTNKVGWLSAVYAERNFYLNNGAQFEKTYRLWYSDTIDPEAVDLSDDGDWIPITSTGDTPEGGRGLLPTYNALLIFKDSEAFALYGTSPESFSVRKLEDDGALSTMSIQSYGGGAIWAGRNGIYFYDGVQVQNLTEPKLGDVYENSIRTFDASRYRMWSAVARNHYLLFVENLDPTVEVVKGNTTVTPTHWTIAINMETRAITMLTNVGIRGAAVLPAERGRTTWILVNDQTAAVGKVINSADMFDLEGLDSFLTVVGGAAGPDYYRETKKFHAGDDLRIKKMEQLSLHYIAQGGSILVDTVTGLNNVGRLLSESFPSSVLVWNNLPPLFGDWNAFAAQYPNWDTIVEGVFLPKRVFIQKTAMHMSLRFYQSVSTMPRVRLGPLQVALKLLRERRVA